MSRAPSKGGRRAGFGGGLDQYGACAGTFAPQSLVRELQGDTKAQQLCGQALVSSPGRASGKLLCKQASKKSDVLSPGNRKLSDGGGRSCPGTGSGMVQETCSLPSDDDCSSGWCSNTQLCCVRQSAALRHWPLCPLQGPGCARLCSCQRPPPWVAFLSDPGASFPLFSLKIL